MVVVVPGAAVQKDHVCQKPMELKGQNPEQFWFLCVIFLGWGGMFMRHVYAFRLALTRNHAVVGTCGKAVRPSLDSGAC